MQPKPNQEEVSQRELSAEGDAQKSLFPENLVISQIGELVNERMTLLNDPEKSGVWAAFGGQDLAALAILAELKVIDDPESGKWGHLLEHCLYVAGVAYAIAKATISKKPIFKQEGVLLLDDMDVIRAGLIHDAGTRYNVESKSMTREAEATGEDTHVVDIMLKHGVNWDNRYDIIAAAKNTGRLYDRYIVEEDGRRANIVNHSPLENIIGYADARTINATVVDLETARAHYQSVKPDAKSQAFFAEDGPWITYYREVEAYLKWSFPEYDPESITDESVFEAVKRNVSDNSTNK